MNMISERLNRCAQTCQDDVYGFSSSKTPEQQSQMEQCTSACASKCSAAIPEMMSRIVNTLKPLMPPTSEFTQGTILAEQPPPPAMPGLMSGLPGGLGSMPPPPGGVGSLPNLGS
eukprot:sb/3476775/